MKKKKKGLKNIYGSTNTHFCISRWISTFCNLQVGVIKADCHCCQQSVRGGWDVAGRQNLNCVLKYPSWVAASLSHREADLESNPPPQGNGPIPLYYWECFSLSFSISLQRDPGSGTVEWNLEFPLCFQLVSSLTSLLSFEVFCICIMCQKCVCWSYVRNIKTKCLPPLQIFCQFSQVHHFSMAKF